MTEVAAKQGGLLEDSTFNIISQLEKKADFLYSSVEKYMRDAKTTSPSLPSYGMRLKRTSRNTCRCFAKSW
jgi:hypothetical protein